ncbi:SirB1 family protein [Spirulina sp. CS-785/01]|uniref:SirB1 family protein n=1 Tax=Spirulina sp. CS-785/01 TaxID=3021716 RepID=UPI003FA79D69
MDFPLARQRFYQEIQQPQDQLDLGKAALYLAQEEYPTLEIDYYLNILDTMAAEVAEQLPESRYPLKIVQTINQYLYEELGFYGNQKDYYNPRNSFLNDVLERRTGIPITLSLVYLEVAKRLDFPMVGIGMPGHFLIRPEFEGVGIFVDAFNQGETLFEQDCEELLQKIYHPSAQLDPRFLEAVSKSRFLARMLSNLKAIYLNKQDFKKAIGAIDRILMLFPDNAMELRDRGLLLYQLDEWTRAIPDLESYLEKAPHAQDVPAIRQLLAKMS